MLCLYVITPVIIIDCGFYKLLYSLILLLDEFWITIANNNS